MKATIVATVEKPALAVKGIISDFPLVNAFRSLIPGGPERQRAVINGGGNMVDVHTSAGTINIRDLDGND
jgi:hypothetical protein